VCWDRDADRALEIAHRVWGNEALPGQLAQTLPRPRDFMDAQALVTKEQVGQAVTTGDDPEKHIAQLRTYVDAGLDEVYVQQIGPDMDGFFTAWEKEVLPAFQ
jgi:hypothetical protein